MTRTPDDQSPAPPSRGRARKPSGVARVWQPVNDPSTRLWRARYVDLDVALDAASLDRIDEIVKPGVNRNPADTSYGEQVFEPVLRRRQ